MHDNNILYRKQTNFILKIKFSWHLKTSPTWNSNQFIYPPNDIGSSLPHVFGASLPNAVTKAAGGSP